MSDGIPSRHILLALCGTSPAVITETVWALERDGITLNEIYVITTAVGRERVRMLLARNPDGPFHCLWKSLRCSDHAVLFDDTTIHVLTDALGQPEKDLRDVESHQRLVSLCFSLARQLTEKNDAQLHFSIAGGRKTMSSALSLAAQLTARTGDQLLHVLVTPPFDSAPDFYYPGSEPKEVQVRGENGRFRVNSEDARVDLIRLPILRFRDLLDKDTVDRILDNPEVLSELPPPIPLEIDCRVGVLRYRGVESNRIPPAHLALYSFFANARMKKVGKDGFLSLAEVEERRGEILNWLLKMGHVTSQSMASTLYVDDLEPVEFDKVIRTYISKLKATIGKTFGHPEFSIVSRRVDSQTLYGIGMPENSVRILTD